MIDQKIILTQTLGIEVREEIKKVIINEENMTMFFVLKNGIYQQEVLYKLQNNDYQLANIIKFKDFQDKDDQYQIQTIGEFISYPSLQNIFHLYAIENKFTSMQ